jgi:sortase A
MSSKLFEDLTVEELHRLLVEKRLGARKDRLARFGRTGKLVEDPQECDRFSSAGPGFDGTISLVSEPHRTWMDHLLFGVETLAILVLVGVVLNGISMFRTLNQNVSAAFQQPTLSPTPLIVSVVLPEGHTPPTLPGGAQPNEAEIPANLRPLVQSLSSLPIPTPGNGQAIRIQIPAIGVDAPVVQGDGWEQLMRGVAQHIGTPDPGQNGNVVLSGHDDVFGEVFRNLDRLAPGDVVTLFTVQRQYSYVVSGTLIVMSTQVEVMNPTPNAILTLISCYPYLVDNHRIVVSAVYQNP